MKKNIKFQFIKYLKNLKMKSEIIPINLELSDNLKKYIEIMEWVNQQLINNPPLMIPKELFDERKTDPR